MRTPLYKKHVTLGAKIVPFAGWEMPLYYSGVVKEHLAVRHAAGLFDISHMGVIDISGNDAAPFLDYLSTNTLLNKKDSSVTYTMWCMDSGGCIDDLLVYQKDSSHFFVVVNAANRQKDLRHLLKEAVHYAVQVADHFSDLGILALQGPNAAQIATELFNKETETIAPMSFMPIWYKGVEIILSRTGYTGSQGFEVYAPVGILEDLWDSFLKVGGSYGILPAGLGARDTLRLEMGYALYGHEISESIAPTESIAAWAVKWKKSYFLGKDVLEKLQKLSTKRMEYGVVLIGGGIAREGAEVQKDGKLIGRVTSGSYSPVLNKAIAIVIVQGELFFGEKIDVLIRGCLVEAQVVKMPFLDYIKGE